MSETLQGQTSPRQLQVDLCEVRMKLEKTLKQRNRESTHIAAPTALLLCLAMLGAEVHKLVETGEQKLTEGSYRKGDASKMHLDRSKCDIITTIAKLFSEALQCL